MELLKRAVAAIFNFLQGIVVVLAIMVMIYLFIMSPQEIKGASMDPNFHNGEYILTNKLVYKLKEPKRGNVVIFKSPQNPDIDYIKRIIGLPGDTVSLKDNMFYIDDMPLVESYIGSDVHLFGGSFLQEDSEIIVPPGMYFVVGDNRPHSADSREFGPVPLEDFIGQAFFRYWPFSELGVIPQPKYLLTN